MNLRIRETTLAFQIKCFSQKLHLFLFFVIVRTLLFFFILVDSQYYFILGTGVQHLYNL